MSRATYWCLATVCAALLGCTGETGGLNPGQMGPGPHGPTPADHAACPVNPDCFTDHSCDVCPEFWVCDNTGVGKHCTNPGPDYPDDSGTWSCEDTAGTTVCRRPGNDFPSGGAPGAWACMLQAEYVVCTDTTPSYPPGGDGTPWDCYFETGRRICDQGPGGGGGWDCVANANGSVECRDTNTDYPDGGGPGRWNCYDMAGEGVTVCTQPPGSIPPGSPPPGGAGWSCTVSADGSVTCTDSTPDFPAGGAPGEWNCTYVDEYRVCASMPGTPTPPPPPDGGTHQCPFAGARRWCDDHVYCSWGIQTCNPDFTWGACSEPMVSDAGLADRPNTACACRFFFFNYECCEDQTDANGDGMPDCIIPADHHPPACEHTGGLCGFCDNDSQCGGGGDMCLIYQDGHVTLDHSSLASFCGQECTGAGCPGGYTCYPVNDRSGAVVSNQCVPSTGRCE